MLESWTWWSVEVILAIPHLDVHILNNIWSVHKGRLRYRFWIIFIRMLGQVEVLLEVQSRFNYWKKTLVLTNVVFHSSCFYMRLALDTEHGLLLSRIPVTNKKLGLFLLKLALWRYFLINVSQLIPFLWYSIIVYGKAERNVYVWFLR